MKKLLSLLLLTVLAVTSIIAFVPAIKAEAVILNSANVKGSDFTDSQALADMLDIVFSGDIDIYSNESCTTETYLRLGTTFSKSLTFYVKSKASGTVYSGGQCYIYANAVYNKVFNEVVYHGSNFAHSKVVISGGSKNASYNMFKSAGVRCGAYMRTTGNSNGSYDGKVGHSMIILSYDATYITYLGGNQAGGGEIDIRKETWSEFNANRISGAGRYIAHVVQPTDAYYDSLYPSHKCTDFEGLGVCTNANCGKTYDWQSTFDLAAVGTYKVVKDFTPRTDAPYDAATKANSSIKKGTSITVTGCYINAFGNKWYVFKYDDGQLGYVLHEYLELVSYNSLNVICTGFTPAENESLPIGQGYPVFGTVSSNYPLTNVVAMLDGSKYATWIAPNNTTTSFEINPTDINHSLKFGSLSAGKHTITLIATDVHGRTQTFLVRSFSMVSTSCSHSYGSSYQTDANNHWKVCTKCGSSTSIEAHIYTNDCDTSCNTCGATRNVSHNYQYSYENSDKYTETHWQECTLCGDKINEEAHTYKPVLNDNGVHMATLKGHYMGCDTCGDLASEEHVYENDCDTICNICNNINSERETSHIYSNDCDSTCNICGEVRSTPEHVYDHDCDTSCNICGLSRSTSHFYDNDCDAECNSCGDVRTVSHCYTSNYLSDKTTHWLKCDRCGCDGYAENHIPGPSATDTTPQVCTACGYVIQAALGHIHSFGDTYYYDNYQHWHQCIEESCDEKTDIAYHVFNNGVVTKEPTETEKGEITYICYICGEKKYQEVDFVVDDEIHTDSEDKINHAECSREANGWQRFWRAIGNFFRMIFGLLPKCVCGEILN